ncbi:methyl-accepting chemotaxis protein [Metasolibacillus fluoroglycofenilyticus]|uniref:methyl-accepting chemotaxis protein n=1 Tax=Metasolibacillus fluoroglycofenilyticus TaxID=1239396 RepID=UPI000D353F68|nr:methyl-accepting chemotaxis protein [Metasolibacillus fluoroglycofenilyticus]
MSIRTKIFLSFAAILLLVLIASSINYTQLQRVQSMYERMIEEEQANVLTIADIRNNMSTQGMLVRQYVISGDLSILPEIIEQREQMTELIESLEINNRDSYVSEELVAIDGATGEFNLAMADAIAQTKALNYEKAKAIINNNLRPPNQNLIKSAANLKEHYEANLEKIQQEAKSTANTASLLSIIVLVLSIVASLIISFVMSKSFLRPIKQLQSALTVVAQGNLQQENVEVKSKDEFRDLANSFNTMKTELKSIIVSVAKNTTKLSQSSEQLTKNTDEVASSVQQTSEVADKLAKGSHNSATAANESATAMDATAEAVQKIVHSTVALHTNALTTQTLANEGGSNIEVAEKQMQAIQQSTSLTNNLINQLIERSNEIDKITAAITEITEQTNLLALNAAIEAARAGEHGKGFSIVADEVRRLAEQSKHSAAAIVQVTTAIRQDTEHVSQAIQESVQNAVTGVAVVQTAGETFNKIHTAIEEMTEEIGEVSSLTEHISATAEEVAASVAHIASDANDAASYTQEVASTIEQQVNVLQELNSISVELKNQSLHLQNIVEKFDC